MEHLNAFDLCSLKVTALLDAMGDGVYVVDRLRRILYWNLAAERITGWPRDRVLGRACFENILVHVDKDGNHLCQTRHCPLIKAMEKQRSSTAPEIVFAQTVTGHRIATETTVSPFLNDQGVSVGGIEVFRDATDKIRDMERAQLLQQSMLDLPGKEDPRIEFAVRYTPIDMVGGDFYRIERRGPDTYAVFVSDAMGHGLSSALFGMQLRAVWEDVIEKTSKPSCILEAMNQRLAALTLRNEYFATAAIGVVNAATGELAYANAGHPAPLLLRATGEATELGECGRPLGMLADSTYNEAREVLQPGDTLLLFTDGASEIFDKQGRELGAVGFRDLVSQAHAASAPLDLKTIERALIEYAKDIRLPDDLTLLAIRRPAAPPSA